MALDTQPFKDLGFNVWLVNPADDSFTVEGMGNGWTVNAANYDDALKQAQNRKASRDLLRQARQAFRDNYTNWASMTAAQKDAANRNAQRAIAGLIGDVLREDN